MCNIHFRGYNDLINMYWGMDFNDSLVPTKWKEQECVFVDIADSMLNGLDIKGKEHGKEVKIPLHENNVLVALYLKTEQGDDYFAMVLKDYKIFKQYYKSISCITRV